MFVYKLSCGKGSNGMTKEDFSLPSTDGQHKLHVVRWLPDGRPTLVLQVVHGMVEHIGRYDAFARAMNERGIAVIGHDHLGHGLTAENDDELGYIGSGNTSDRLVEDMWAVTQYIREQYPHLPNCIMGHSMGSFLTRKYLTKRSGDVAAAIIMGTGFTPGAVASTALTMTNIIGKRKGEHHRSATLTKMALGPYSKAFSEPDSPAAWLTKDPEIVRIHDADKYATFVFTVNAYRALFSTLRELASWKDFKNVRRDLPVLICSGEDDPVGNYGKGPKKVYEGYLERGMKRVTLKLYPGDRHEIINELDRERVCADISDFLLEAVK